jgi:hypothetical protein
MKTKELIEVLKACDPEQEVSFQMDDGCCGDYLSLDAYDFEHIDDYNRETRRFGIPGWLTVRFRALPGYRSCRQSGGTIRADKEYWKKFGKKVE